MGTSIQKPLHEGCPLQQKARRVSRLVPVRLVVPLVAAIKITAAARNYITSRYSSLLPVLRLDACRDYYLYNCVLLRDEGYVAGY